jgi:hypothetical protein
MSEQASDKRPAPRTLQEKRLRWRYGLNSTNARLIASLHYEAMNIG